MRKIIVTGKEKDFIAKRIGEIYGFKLAQITYDSNLYEPDDDDILYEAEFHPINKTNLFEDEKTDFIVIVDYRHRYHRNDLIIHYGLARYSSDHTETWANKIYKPIASGRLTNIERIEAIVAKQLEFDNEIRRMKRELD